MTPAEAHAYIASLAAQAKPVEELPSVIAQSWYLEIPRSALLQADELCGWAIYPMNRVLVGRITPKKIELDGNMVPKSLVSAAYAPCSDYDRVLAAFRAGRLYLEHLRKAYMLTSRCQLSGSRLLKNMEPGDLELLISILEKADGSNQG